MRTVWAGFLIAFLTSAGFCGEPQLEIIQALKISGYTPGEENKQTLITTIPDSIKTKKCAVLNGVSMLDITRSGKLNLKEGSLVIWVNVPSKPSKNFRPAEINSLMFVIGSDLVKNSKKDGFENLAVQLEPDDRNKDKISPSTSMRGKGSIASFPINDKLALNGWHQMTLCFAERFSALYLDGVLADMASQSKTNDLILPLNIDNILIRNGSLEILRNGKVEDHGMDLGPIGVGKILIIDRSLSTEEVRAYREAEKLPEAAKIVWTIDFSKGKPDKTAGDLKINGKIDFKEIK